MTNINDLLSEREETHGDFAEVAYTYKQFQSIITTRRNYWKISDSQRLALDMIAVKLSRLLCGDSNFSGHAEDIAGYATLIVKELEAKAL